MKYSFFLWSALLVAPATLPAHAAEPRPMSGASVAAANWNVPLTGDRKIVHVLNRLSFGPRPGDVAAVRQQGLNRWIEAQLRPDSLNDSALEKQLKTLLMLNETPQRLLLAYEADNGKIRKAIEASQKGNKPKAKANPVAAQAINAREQRVMDAFLASGMEVGASAQALGELTAAKLARAVDSKKQLQEVLVDFWGNHFNVDINKNAVRVLKVLDDRNTIRPHVFGSFRELLGASAKSPAMLIYLDNAKSTVEINQGNPKRRGGLNENYGREIMELHTLGVDGGYTQKDVTEVARCFTGWGIDRKTGTFEFSPRRHDNGAKTVLGRVIPAGGGQKDGEMVLDILATHPATAQHLARQLCMRFVADEPPASLVTKVAVAFTQSKGDLRATYRALFDAPEFLSEGAYRAKIKSPLEFAASATRALDGHFALADPDNANQRKWLIAIGLSARGKNNGANLPRRPLATEIANMGQPLWGYQAPTGYPEDSRQWVSSSALVARLNFALSLTSGRIGDVLLDKDTFRNERVAQVANTLLSEPLSATSVATIEDEIKVAPGDGAKVRALILGSPEFQRR